MIVTLEGFEVCLSKVAPSKPITLGPWMFMALLEVSSFLRWVFPLVALPRSLPVALVWSQRVGGGSSALSVKLGLVGLGARCTVGLGWALGSSITRFPPTELMFFHLQSPALAPAILVARVW